MVQAHSHTHILIMFCNLFLTQFYLISVIAIIYDLIFACYNIGSLILAQFKYQFTSFLAIYSSMQQSKSHSSTRTIPKSQMVPSVHHGQIHNHNQLINIQNKQLQVSYMSEKNHDDHFKQTNNQQTQSNALKSYKLQVYRFSSPQARKQGSIHDQEQRKTASNIISPEKQGQIYEKMQIQHDNITHPIKLDEHLIKLEEMSITSKNRKTSQKIASNQSQIQELNTKNIISNKNKLNLKLIFEECFKNQESEEVTLQTIRNSQLCIQDIENPILQKINSIEGLKKTMLKHFCYSGSNTNCQKIKIYFLNLYNYQHSALQYPIKSDQNLNTILYNYIKDRKDISIRMIRQTDLRKYTQRSNKKKITVQFDSDGELDERQEDLATLSVDQLNIRASIKVNTPQTGKYIGQNLMRCGFCQKSTKDINGIKVCGPFYGPFRSKKKVYYVHLLCAIWCSRVYIQDGRLKSVSRQIDDSRRDFCKYCQKNGAGLQCHNKACKVTTHYECALEFCDFNWPQYTFKCHLCRTDQKQSHFQQSQSVVSEQKNHSNQVECKMQVQYPIQSSSMSLDNKKQSNSQKRKSSGSKSKNKTTSNSKQKLKQNKKNRMENSEVKIQNTSIQLNNKKSKK